MNSWFCGKDHSVISLYFLWYQLATILKERFNYKVNLGMATLTSVPCLYTSFSWYYHSFSPANTEILIVRKSGRSQLINYFDCSIEPYWTLNPPLSRYLHIIIPPKIYGMWWTDWMWNETAEWWLLWCCQETVRGYSSGSGIQDVVAVVAYFSLHLTGKYLSSRQRKLVGRSNNNRDIARTWCVVFVDLLKQTCQ